MYPHIHPLLRKWPIYKAKQLLPMSSSSRLFQNDFGTSFVYIIYCCLTDL